MGYTTEFTGQLTIVPAMPLSKVSEYNDRFEDHSTLSPGGYNDWELINSMDGKSTFLAWNGSEKFYEYVEWLKWVIEHVLKPDGHVANGEIKWSGEEPYDLGLISVDDNVVTVKEGTITYG